MKYKPIYFLVLAAGILSGTAASAQTADAPKIITAVDDAALREALAGIEGAAVTYVRKDQAGQLVYSVTLKDGMAFNATLEACSPGCKIVDFYTRFSLPANKTPAQIDQAILQFNDSHFAAKIYRIGDGIVSEGFVTSDGGITIQNLRAHIWIYDIISKGAMDYLK